MTPWDRIADAITPGPGDPAANVYRAFAEQLEAPALVIRPDDPWMEPHAFSFDQERYAIIAAVTASTPADGVATLYALLRHVIGAVLDLEGVSYESVTAPIIDESTGAPFLAATVHVIYRSCDEES